MPLFGWTAKEYFGTQKKRVQKVGAKIKKAQEKSRKREIEKLEKQTELYEARGRLRKAKMSAKGKPSDPFSLRGKLKKAGKSGRMRLI